MRRRIIRLGSYSQVVSLPRKWLLRNGEPHEVWVEEADDTITISPLPVPQSIRIDCSLLAEWSLHFLSQLYQSGARSILLQRITKAIHRDIMGSLWNFPGTIAKPQRGGLLLTIREPKLSITALVQECLRLTEESLLALTLLLSGAAVERDTFEENLRAVLARCELLTRKVNTSVHQRSYYYLHEIPMSLIEIHRLIASCAAYCFERHVLASGTTLRLLQESLEYLRGIPEGDLQKHVAYRRLLLHAPLREMGYFDACRKDEIFMVEKAAGIARELSRITARGFLYSRITGRTVPDVAQSPPATEDQHL